MHLFAFLPRGKTINTTLNVPVKYVAGAGDS